jgi:hypothetical protein
LAEADAAPLHDAPAEADAEQWLEAAAPEVEAVTAVAEEAWEYGH